jgi:DNA-binding LacI/PurR family transcriptional regulator
VSTRRAASGARSATAGNLSAQLAPSASRSGASGDARLVRPPVMADVARLAGVSSQTVSRVVNGHPGLRPDTQERVAEAIRLLGYRPNSAARGLVTRRSGTIGVIGSQDGFWDPGQLDEAVQEAGLDAGFFVSAVNVPDLTRDAVQDAVDHLRDQSVEGIVLIAANDEALEVAHAQEATSTPVVVVQGSPYDARWAVGVDQVAGAELATRHLLDLGHTGIVHVAGPLQWNEARARLQGWHTTMRTAGLRPPPHLQGDWTAESGYRIGAELAGREQVTAVFVANDQMALGVLRALWEAGRSVPGDVSVVGFDDIPEAEFLVPPLTTVRQDFTAVGHRALEVLRTAIGDVCLRAEERLIQPELVVRASAAPPSVT